MSSVDRPRVILLETSGRVGQVALAEGDRLLAVKRLDETRRHARDLAPAVSELLQHQQWKPRDVHAVFVSRGPGSYTGLRVGIMSAKAFAYATGCGLITVDTFAAIAEPMPPEVMGVDVIADAQQDKIYVQSFARVEPGAETQATSPLAIQNFADWLAQRSTTNAIAGPGLERFGMRVPAETIISDPTTWNPQPESVLRLGLRRWVAGEHDDVWTVEPLYLRASSAEEKWKERSPRV